MTATWCDRWHIILWIRYKEGKEVHILECVDAQAKVQINSRNETPTMTLTFFIHNLDEAKPLYASDL